MFGKLTLGNSEFAEHDIQHFTHPTKCRFTFLSQHVLIKKNIIWVINQPLGKPLVKEQTNPLASLLGSFGFGFAGKTTAGVNTIKLGFFH